MTITYLVGNSLYLNITNHCTNACDFCVRTQSDGHYADNLWLERERAMAGTVTPDCRDGCEGCGLRRFDGVCVP